MNIAILKNNLKDSLAVLSGTKKEHSQLPILKNFLIETKDGKIVTSSTDLEIGIIHSISGKVLEEGALTVPYGTFSQIINNIGQERITLETKGQHMVVSTDNYSGKIATAPKDDFPIIPTIHTDEVRNTLTVENETLIEALSGVIAACQVSDFRPELSGILFHMKEGSLTFVATDSFRLAKKTISSKKIKIDNDENMMVIVPLKTVQEVVRIFGSQKKSEMEILFDKTQVLFRSETTELISRIIEGKFPDYEMVIPKFYDTEITLPKEDIISALRLISSLANRLHEVRVVLDESLKNIKLTSSSQELGEGEYILPAKIKGQPTAISFNWRFMLDGIRQVKTPNVFIGLNGEQKPSCIQAPDDDTYMYVLTSIKSG